MEKITLTDALMKLDKRVLAELCKTLLLTNHKHVITSLINALLRVKR